MFQENKWYNLGDVNPRIHGGMFVKRVGNEIEVVETTNNEDHGGKGYSIGERSENVDDLKTRFDKFKRTGVGSVGNSADWKRYVELEKEDEALSFFKLLISKYPFEEETRIAQEKIKEIR